MTFTGRGLYASSSKVPRGRRFGWLFAGAIVALLAVAFGLATGIGMISTSGEQKSDSFTDVAEVVLDNNSQGSITVVGSDGDDVTVERSTRTSIGVGTADSVRKDGDALLVDADCHGVTLVGGCSVDYSVKVPHGTRLDLTAPNGDITVRRLHADVEAEGTNGSIKLVGVKGDVRAETVNGSVHAEGAGDRLEADSVNGRINAAGFAAKDAEVGSVNGAVKLGGGFTTASAETVTGSIRVATGSPFKSLTAESTAGEVTLKVPDGAYQVTGESTAGDRAVDVPTSADAESLIDVNTVAGEVRIKPLGG